MEVPYNPPPPPLPYNANKHEQAHTREKNIEKKKEKKTLKGNILSIYSIFHALCVLLLLSVGRKNNWSIRTSIDNFGVHVLFVYLTHFSENKM